MTVASFHDAPPLVARVLEHLEHVTIRPSGRAWRAACPCPHESGDDDKLLLITLARDGRVLLDCQAKCALADILDSIGLKLGDLYPKGLDDEAYRLSEGPAPSAETEELAQLPRAIRAIDAPPLEPVEWIVNDIFTAGEIGLFVGDGGTFKSTAAINMAAAVAAGAPVWDRFAAEQRPTLIVSAEDSLDIVMMRLQAFIDGHGYDRTQVLSNVHLFATTDVLLSNLRWQNHLTEEVDRIGAGLVIFDPFAELIGVDENSNSEIRPIVKYLRTLARGSGAAVNVVHHAGKQGPDKRIIDRIRGASALPSAARSILFFDYQPNGAGVAVQHLKMSRTPRLDPFILSRSVTHHPDNRALWSSATLSFMEVRAAQTSRAEAFVLGQVTAAPRAHTTSDLRQLGKKDNIRSEDIGIALNVLHQTGQIGFESGPRGAKKWFAMTPGAESKPSNDLVQFELGKVDKVEN